MNEQTKCIACEEGSREALVSWDNQDPEYAYTARINESFVARYLVPAFTAEEVRRMAKETEGVKGCEQISEINEGEFQIASEDAAPDSSAGFSEVVAPTKCCGLYFIGDGWTWEEISPEPICRECGKPSTCSCGVSSHL